MTATTIPSALASHRQRMMAKTGLKGDAYGIAPNEAHKEGGGYHCGLKDCQNIGKFHPPAISHVGSGTEDYSVRQLRDRGVGGNAASAEDIGYHWPNGGDAAWLRFNNLLVARLQAGEQKLRAVREINFSPDGKQRKRWDALHPEAGIVNSTDTVTIHTHIGYWRDTDGQEARLEAFARIEQIADAAIENRPLPAPEDDEEDDMGASFGPIDIRREGATSLTIPPVQAGAADPRQAWLNFCNDTGGEAYGLRIWVSQGKGAFTGMPGTDGEGLVKLTSGQRWSSELPAGTACITVMRAAIDENGKVVMPDTTNKLVPYAKHLTCAIERGPVKK